MREKIYDIIEVKEEESIGSTLYDAFMLLTIIASIIPLCFKKQTAYMEIIDQVTVSIFIIDYLLRWSTADYKLKRYKSRAFLYYPFTTDGADRFCFDTSVADGFKSGMEAASSVSTCPGAAHFQICALFAEHSYDCPRVKTGEGCFICCRLSGCRVYHRCGSDYVSG